MPPEFRNYEEVHGSRREDSEHEPVYCADCGDEIPADEVGDYYNADGEYICADCAENYGECASTGEIYHYDDLIYSDTTGEYFCDDAYYDRFARCEECDDEIDLEYDDYEETSSGYVCTNGCASQNYPEWLVIDKLYPPAGSIPESLEVGDGVVYRYADKQSFDKIPSERSVGIEIEHYNNTGDSNAIGPFVWRRQLRESTIDYANNYTAHPRDVSGYDGSLHNASSFGQSYVGSEIDMKPRRGDYLWKDIGIVTDAVKFYDGEVDASCGQHMHFDSRDLDWYHRIVLAAYVKAIEPHLYTMLPPSRRSSRYCVPMSQSWGEFTSVRNRDQFIDFWYDTHRYTDSRWNDKRYYGLNMHPGIRESGIGSIEVRYHSGTLNPTKMRAWAIFWTSLIDYTKEIANELYASEGTDIARVLLKDSGISMQGSRFGNLLKIHNIHLDDIGAVDWVDVQDEIYKLEPDYARQIIGITEQLAHERLANDIDDVPLSTEIVPGGNDYMVGAFGAVVNRLFGWWNPVMNMSSLYDRLNMPDWVRLHFRNRTLERIENTNTPDTHIRNCLYNKLGILDIKDNGTLEISSMELDRLSISSIKVPIDDSHAFTGPPYPVKSNHLGIDWFNSSMLNDSNEQIKTELMMSLSRRNEEGTYDSVIESLES